jgi:hypothetical protein
MLPALLAPAMRPLREPLAGCWAIPSLRVAQRKPRRQSGPRLDPEQVFSSPPQQVAGSSHRSHLASITSPAHGSGLEASFYMSPLYESFLPELESICRHA